MELNDYIQIARKRWRVILATTMVVLGLAAIFTVATPKSYQATTRLFVSTAGGDTSADLLQGSSFTQKRVTSYADVIKSPKVLNPVIGKLRLDQSAAQLVSSIEASVPPDTVLLQVSVTRQSPRQATDIADAVGKQFTKTVAELETVGSDQRSPVKVTVIGEPTIPTSPVSPKPARNLALGVVLGLLLGAAVAVLRERLDTRIKGEKDCELVTDATVIGGIAYDPDAPDHPLIVQGDRHSPRAEAFRSLRTNLQFVDAANHPKSIVFTSSVPDEGKTTTTANLATTLAASGAKVCIIEADLRRPRMLKYMGMEGAVGLTSVLIGHAQLEDVLQPFADTHVSVLGAGPIPPNPSELLGSPAMRDTLRELERRFDYVVIDAPPLLPVTDAAVLSTVADGVVVIVGAGSTTREQLRKSLQSLEQVKGRLLGLVLNKLPRKGPDSYAYYRDGYTPDAASSRVTSERKRAKQDAEV